MIRNSKAFSLVEVAMGIAVMSMIALSVATVSSALTGAYMKGQNYTAAVQTARASMLRVQSAIRKARVLGECDSNNILTWQESPQGNGTMSLTDLRLLTYRNGQIWEYQVVFPSGWPQWMINLCNSTIALNDLVASCGYYDNLLQTYYSQSTQISGNLTGFSASAYYGAPTDTLVKLHMTAGTGAYAINLRSQVCLRTPVAVSQQNWPTGGQPTGWGQWQQSGWGQWGYGNWGWWQGCSWHGNWWQGGSWGS